MAAHQFDTAADPTLPGADIFDSLARQFPVCMTSDEFHFFPQAVAPENDGSRWDDFSPGAVAEALDRLAGWERRLKRPLPDENDPERRADADMLLRVVGTLRSQLSEVRPHETQPTFYLTIAGIGLAEAVEAGSRAAALRLAGLPVFFDQARENLNRIPRLFRGLGIEMLAKQKKWILSLPLPDTARRPVIAAFDRLDAHLRQVPVREEFLPPVDLYERIAFDHMGCRLPSGDIADALDDEIEETGAILARTAEALAPGRTWQAVVEDLPRPEQPPGGVRAVYEETIDDLARHCASNGLASAALTAACPVKVAPIPDYMRPVRSNAAYSMPPVHPPRGGTFFISDAGRNTALPADYRLLAAHETYPGHHLLDTRRWGHPRPVRRHIEFPIFYEGWASFSEEILFDTGFFSGAADRLLMAKRRFWRAVRGRIDLDLHMRTKSLAEAEAVLTGLGMPGARAGAMVRRYALKPGYQLAYTIGRRRFRGIYENIRRRGSDPADFARGVLAQGEIGFDYLEMALEESAEPQRQGG